MADLIATHLEGHDDRFATGTATDARDGLDQLRETDVDCIVSDYDMPIASEDDVLEAVVAVESNGTRIDQVRRRVRTLAGETLMVEITARRIKWEGETGHVVIVRDVTER